MRKIVTDEGTVFRLKTERLNYMEYDGKKLIPKSIKIIGTFLGEPKIQGLTLDEWFKRVIDGKIIVASSKMPTTEMDLIFKDLSVLSDPYLVVEDVRHEYITHSLFNVLSNLLDSEIKIKSLEWME